MSWWEQLHTINPGEVVWAGLMAYVLGCFATGYYLVLAVRRKDIRTLASGNIGARNVGRVLGKTGFVINTAGDALKGMLAIWAAGKFFHDPRIASFALLAVVAGHIWPAQLRFHGGKGVATSLGALAVYDWRLLIAFGVVFVFGLALARRTVLPGLFGFVCLPATDYWLHQDGLRMAVLITLALVILLAHRKNLVVEFSALLPIHRLPPNENHKIP